jgi:diguanylate cyclase (GGDEF)-like protein
VLPGVPAARAHAIAERARQAIEAAEFHLHEQTFHISISMGVAQARPDEARDALLERVDAALYEAKHSGRNRSVVAP